MAVVFQLTGNQLSVAQWEQIFGAWQAKIDFDLWDEPSFEEGENESVALIAGEGSIRGVVFFYREGKVEMLLSDLSSRCDWRTGFRLLRAAVRWGGGTITTDSGETFDESTLTPIKSEESAIRDFVAAIGRLRSELQRSRSTSCLFLTMGAFSIPVSLDDLPPCEAADVPRIEARLTEHARKYGEAYRPWTLDIGGDRTSTSWAAIPTIIAKVDIVSVSLDLSDEIRYPSESVAVPFERLISILGERAEELSNDMWFLPGLEPGSDDELITAFRDASVDLETYDPNAFPAALDLVGLGEELDGIELDLEVIDDEPEPAREVATEEQASIELDASELETYVFEIMRSFLDGKSPQESTDSLTALGVPDDLAAELVALVGIAAHSFLSDEGDSESIVAQFADHGVPENLSLAILQSMAKAFRELE